MITIQTERCTLTALRDADLENMVRLFTDPDVWQFLGGPPDAEKIRAQTPKVLAGETATRYWAIRSVADDSFMGVVTLSDHHDGVDTEISYMLLPEFWGSGYATESVQAILTYGLTELGLPRIIAETQTANLASLRLLDRVGMKLERTLERFDAAQSIYILVQKSFVPHLKEQRWDKPFLGNYTTEQE